MREYPSIGCSSFPLFDHSAFSPRIVFFLNILNNELLYRSLYVVTLLTIGYAWVTLATNDAYSLGALVLAHSLRRVDTVHDLAVLVTPGVTETMRWVPDLLPIPFAATETLLTLSIHLQGETVSCLFRCYGSKRTRFERRS